jgi:hypothetical protein
MFVGPELYAHNEGKRAASEMEIGLMTYLLRRTKGWAARFTAGETLEICQAHTVFLRRKYSADRIVVYMAILYP